MNLKILFSGKKLVEKHSPFNGKIMVFEQGSRRRLAVGSFNYSLFSKDPNDLLLDRYWGKLVLGIKERKKEVEKVLILGLGGGTFVHLLNYYFTPGLIEGIEIDPVVINLGRDYFYLSTFSNLKIYQKDAYRWLDEFKDQKQNFYDLIIFDLYRQARLPDRLEGIEFVESIFNLLNPSGMVAFNRVCYKGQEKEIIDDFTREKLEPFFSNIEVQKIKGALSFNNFIFYAQNPKRGGLK